ncbi:hypothetical protein [Methylobacterium isbiliense]|jgi:hypothetical protein|uniref:Uncharacterized protein n=1 Tax=Methylobacterium isbiliense TaxID=315478 RepID=A0ABQ4SJI1_9HYPH|nr:hypothetical protein [Methylobacterium isbiliense]MDN3627384.1 hypothetical protein [Methylobacterium isbiliense]GJE02033.1 hypothetical protein GMJLKIPL_3977 [Methylobacterium isbiliense]
MVAVEDDEIARLRDRQHAARRALGEAYDRRDALAEEVAAAEAAGAGALRPELLVAFSAAERAVLAAEAEMKDAEYALAVAIEPPVSTTMPRASE